MLTFLITGNVNFDHLVKVGRDFSTVTLHFVFNKYLA